MPLEAPVTMAVGVLVICVTHVEVSVVVRLVYWYPTVTKVRNTTREPRDI